MCVCSAEIKCVSIVMLLLELMCFVVMIVAAINVFCCDVLAGI